MEALVTLIPHAHIHYWLNIHSTHREARPYFSAGYRRDVLVLQSKTKNRCNTKMIGRLSTVPNIYKYLCNLTNGDQR